MGEGRGDLDARCVNDGVERCPGWDELDAPMSVCACNVGCFGIEWTCWVDSEGEPLSDFKLLEGASVVGSSQVAVKF